MDSVEVARSKRVLVHTCELLMLLCEVLVGEPCGLNN